MDGALQDLGTAIAAALPGAIRASTVAFGELTLDVEAARLIETVHHLRDDPRCQFVSFIDLTAVDYPDPRAALRCGHPSALAEPQPSHPYQSRDR